MVSGESRIVCAVMAVFTALAGIGAAIRGLLDDSPGFIHYGAAALVIGVIGFVALLVPTPHDSA